MLTRPVRPPALEDEGEHPFSLLDYLLTSFHLPDPCKQREKAKSSGLWLGSPIAMEVALPGLGVSNDTPEAFESSCLRLS